MAHAVGVAFGEFLLLVVVGRHLSARGGLGIGDAVDIHVDEVVAAHLGRHGEVADDDVLLLLHIVIIVVAVGVVPFAVVAVFLVVVAVAVPILGLTFLVLNHGLFHLFRGEGIVGGTEVEAELVHGAWLHLDVVGKDDGERLPLVGVGIVDGQPHLLLETACLTYAVGLAQLVVLHEREDIVVEDTHDSQRHRVEADGVKIHRGLLHLRDDDAVVGPTHLRQVVGKVEVEGIVALHEHAVGGADAAAHGHVQLRQFIVVE